MPAVKRARSTLVVAPADGQTFAVAGDSADKITLLLDDVKAKICVRTQLEGREPSPETCLQNVGSVDLFNVPRGGLRLLVRDADREESLSIAVAKTKEFVPGDDWREVGEKAVPAGLDIRLPLDGAAKVARVPPTWRLQLYVEPPDGRPGFWRGQPYAIPNLTAPHPINASCVLRKLPQPWAARIHFFSYVASDLYHMLAHALRYYRRLGVDFEKRAKFVVHNASGPSVLAKATTYLERYGARYDVSSAWSSAMKRQAANAYLASLPADAWLVYPDLDEFFAFPCELPAESREYAIDHQFPRSCALTEKLHKYTLVPARDAAGSPLAYINAHSVTCRGDPDRPEPRRRLAKRHAQRAIGCAGVVVHRGPDIAHYGFTKVTVPMMERKLETYRALYAAEGTTSSLDAVAHYERLRDNFEWCAKTRSYQFTAEARRRVGTMCAPLGADAEDERPDMAAAARATARVGFGFAEAAAARATPWVGFGLAKAAARATAPLRRRAGAASAAQERPEPLEAALERPQERLVALGRPRATAVQATP
ncbi:hypothetical protein JL720_15529 [Aureococcus anophagefferens]|nr:hypothetical protein JL720_15529 [Aureococcus anophagefferens]